MGTVLPSIAGVAAVALLGLAPPALAGSAAASYTCSGAHGSIPAGTYSTVTVIGFCSVNAGPVVVTGDVTVAPGAALVAAYGMNDHTGHGTSSIAVGGTLSLGRGATAVLGCEPNFFTCVDDPNQSSPTLRSAEKVAGSVVASAPLGILVHASTISGDVRESGGGGGVNCNPAGAFKVFGSPVYSDFEDNTILGNLSVVGLRSCWLGALRDRVGGSVTFAHDVMADPDAMEVLDDHIAGNLVCEGNSPANQYGDSHSSPSVVTGSAVGQCAFAILSPNPAPSGPKTHLAVPSGIVPGYVLGSADGGVFAFGTPFFGSAPGTAEILPYVGIAAAPGGRGYWLASGTGRVVGFGPNAPSFGDAAALSLNAPIVGIAAAPGGDGYWLAGRDGGVFGYGPATRFFGSAAGSAINAPVVGIAAAPTGDGYLLASSDGGVFAYGPGARFHGSAAGKTAPGHPIVGIAVDPATGGYWLVANDGTVYAFDAPDYGSPAGSMLNAPIVGIATAAGGNGYYLAGKDGGVFAFGPGARFRGSAAGQSLNQPVDGVGVA